MFYYSSVICLSLMMILMALLSGWSWVLEFYIMNSKVWNLSVSFFLDKESATFILTVLFIFMMVCKYSLSYLSTEVFLKRFLVILSLFVASMCVLIMSSSLFSSLIGWDGLGVTSLFLILFYYSKSSFKAGTLTFLMNRVGDCFFILALTQILLVGENQLHNSCSVFSTKMVMFIILTSITKSAQIPFSTWLPAAMEAPTPVSALVHSSTLVTAGIYLLYRYSIIWINSTYKDVLMALSIATCFMAAMSALVESDLKKLIALSTLSQLGFIMFTFSLGLMAPGFLHMLMHAYFKALLFMCAGLVIHSFKGSQSIVTMSLSKSQNPLLMTIMSCSLMSMSGLPFLAGFYSKDLIIDSFKGSEWVFLIFFLLWTSFVLTILYCTRIVWYLMNSSSNWHSMSDSDFGMIKPMIPLAILASLGGSASVWILMESDFYIETTKVPVLLLLTLVSATYWSLQMVTSFSFLESKWNLSLFNSMLSNLFFRKAMDYKYSCDLLGAPEVLNMQIFKVGFHDYSEKVIHTMVHYSGTLEFFVFMMSILIFV